MDKAARKNIVYINAAFGRVSAIYNMIITKSEVDFLVGQYMY